MNDNIPLSSLSSYHSAKSLPPLFINSHTTSEESCPEMNFPALKNNELIKGHEPLTIPQSESDEMPSLKRLVSSLIFEISARLHFDEEPLLSSLTPETYPEEFVNKCTQCSQICDFTDKNHLLDIQQKANIIQDMIISFKNDQNINNLKESDYLTFFNFIKKNIIRSLPDAPLLWFEPYCVDFRFDIIEEEGWTHMDLAYQAMVAFIDSPSYKVTLNNVTIYVKKLIPKILRLFSSVDLRERQMVTKVLYSIYKKHPKLRSNIREQCCHFFRNVLTSDRPKLGCAEILRFLIPVIQGFKVPLHQTNLDIFLHYLIPLHSSSYYHLFYDQIVQAITSYLQLDPKLVHKVVLYLLNKWPKTNPYKEIMFLSEIKSFLTFFTQSPRRDVFSKLCHTLADCILSPNFFVTEHSLMMWKSDAFIQLNNAFKQEVFRWLIPSLFKTAELHWCHEMRTLSIYVLQLLKGVDAELFNQIGSSLKAIESHNILMDIESGHRWSSLALNCFSPGEARELQEKIQTQFIGCEAILGSPGRKESAKNRVGGMEENKHPPKAVGSNSGIIVNGKRGKDFSGKLILKKQIVGFHSQVVSPKVEVIRFP